MSRFLFCSSHEVNLALFKNCCFNLFFFTFPMCFIFSVMPYLNGCTVLLLGICYEFVLKPFSIIPAGIITDLSIPLG